MKMEKTLRVVLISWLILSTEAPQCVTAQEPSGAPLFKQEQLEQLLAPIALYPDDLLAQIFMAATYPLEIVQAARWVKANPSLKGDQLTAALEKENWDPSVKSLVNFPEVLEMMNGKLDWTQQLGDAVLAQQKDVMAAVQNLRQKAQSQGSLKTTSQQTVTVEPQTQTIVIQPSDPQVVYVPTYNPEVVYGAWAYPAYPPYPVYPPGYVAGAAFSFLAGAAIGAAWGYAWGGCNWGGGDIDMNVNRNANINNSIDRSKYSNRVTSGSGGRGEWKHNPQSRRGVSYRDQGTAQRFGQQARASGDVRRNYGGFDNAGGRTNQISDRMASQQRPGAGNLDRGGLGDSRGTAGSLQGRGGGAFGGSDRGGDARQFSNRGNGSLASGQRGGGFNRGSSGGLSRGGGGGAGRFGGGGGGARGGGGGARGGGGGARGGGGGGRRR